MTGRLAQPGKAAAPPVSSQGRAVRALRVYVASSVRNERFDDVVAALREAGHDVYDFKAQGTFFPWGELAGANESDAAMRRELLDHPRAKRAFLADMVGLIQADVCVLVLPAGASSHLELGYATGAGKRTIILLEPGAPELMYAMATKLCTSIEEVLLALPRRGAVR